MRLMSLNLNTHLFLVDLDLCLTNKFGRELITKLKLAEWIIRNSSFRARLVTLSRPHWIAGARLKCELKLIEVETFAHHFPVNLLQIMVIFIC